MEKAVNRWIFITAAGAVIFALAAFFLRSEAAEVGQRGDYTLPVYDYIEIDMLKANVTIKQHKEEYIKFSFINDVPLEVDLGDNSLKIKESEKFVLSIFAGDRSEFGLVLTLPEKVYRSIEITTASGAVKLSGIKSERTRVVTGSGNIIADNIDSLYLLTTNSGNITMDFNEIVEGCSATARTGDVEFIIPSGGSAAVDFETDGGKMISDFAQGEINGSYLYGINGGETLIHASLESGTLFVSEKINKE